MIKAWASKAEFAQVLKTDENGLDLSILRTPFWPCVV